MRELHIGQVIHSKPVKSRKAAKIKALTLFAALSIAFGLARTGTTTVTHGEQKPNIRHTVGGGVIVVP